MIFFSLEKKKITFVDICLTKKKYQALKYAFGMTNIYKIEMYFIFLDLFYQIWLCQKIHQSYLCIVDVCDVQKNKKMVCSLNSECQSSHLIKNKDWFKIK